MRRNLGLSGILSLGIGLIISCQVPSAPSNLSGRTGAGRVTIAVSTTGPRTLVANFGSQITSYSTTLTCPGQTSLSQTASGPSVSFFSVPAGTWAINVTAISGNGIVGVGAGTVTIAGGSSSSTSVTLSTTQNLTGGYSFAFEIPAGVYSGGVTSVTAKRYACTDANLTSPLATFNPMLVLQSDGNYGATVAEPSVTSGYYLLQLNFMRGITSAGTFVEAVNIWDHVTSDQWLDSTGTAQPKEVFSASAFNSSDASLSNLTLAGSLYPTFSSGTTSYVAYTSSAATATATGSIPGQMIQYQLDTGGWSGTMPSLSAGHVLNIKVTAPDNTTSQTYTINDINRTLIVNFSLAGLSSYSALSLGSPQTIIQGQSLTFAPNFSGATNWIWTVNGTSSGTSQSFTFPFSNPGYYTINVTCSFGGVLYSGSTNVTVSDTGITMVPVPGGTFQRDSTPGDLSTVSSFLISAYDVTQALYTVVMGSNPSSPANGGTYPVTNVNWYAALAFCNRLSVQQGLSPVYSINGSTNPGDWGSIPAVSPNITWDAAVMNRNANGYRLPTEMEWMWAAMGATSDSCGGYSGGIDTTGFQKTFAGSNGSNSMGASVNVSGPPQPVGQFAPNELGLYDMSGNVLQWCWDIFGGSQDSYVGKGPLTNFAGQWSGGTRILRGGAAGCGGAPSETVAARQWPTPDFAASYGGFRVVRSNGAQYIPTDGLVGQWMFADAGSSTALDTSGSHPAAPYNGTNITGVTAVSDRKGTPQWAYYFTSGASGISVTDSTLAFACYQPFSISVWFTVDPSVWNTTSPWIVGENGTLAGQFNYAVVISSKTVQARVGKLGDDFNFVSAPVAAGTWYHVVEVYDGSHLRLYLNGVVQGNPVPYTFGSLSSSQPPLTFGGTGGGLVGSISGCRIYNRVLTPAEVSALYNE